MAMGNLHLTPQLVQAVRDAVDIVAIASDHTRLKQNGKRWGGLCPLHKEKTPSFSVDPEQGLYYCFGCGQGGDAIKLHMQLSGDEFPEAIEALAMRYGIPLPARGQRHAGGEQERDLRPILEAAAEFFRHSLAHSAMASDYLRQRKIPPPLIESYSLGYAPNEWQALIGSLTPRFSVKDLAAAGLIVQPEGGKRPYDRYRNRLIFPIHNASGRLVGFGGRTLGEDRAKYINSNETASFRKSSILYGLNQAKRTIRDGGVAILVEGYFDVIGAAACGLGHAVAGMGTALTVEQSRLLARYAEEVVIAYDGDSAGDKAFRRALPLLLAEDLEVRRAHFGEGEDPDSLRLKEGEEAVRQAVDSAQDGVMMEFNRILPRRQELGPSDLKRVSEQIIALLGRVSDPIVKSNYWTRAAERLGTSPEILRQKIAQEGRKARRYGEEEELLAPIPVRRQVRGLEEQVLSLLLAGQRPVPPLDQLPPAEVFLDTQCGNIFRAFVALYKETPDGAPPTAQAVLATLGSEDSIDRLAQILLEKSADPGIAGLVGLLGTLEKRWQQKRQRDLAAEIGEAQRRGDHERLERLVQAKTSLSRSLHRGPAPEPEPT